MSRARLNHQGGHFLLGLIGCLGAVSALRCGSAASREIEGFRQAFARIEFANSGASEDQSLAAARALDDVVAALLNSSDSPATIKQRLASLPGSDASTGVEPADEPFEWPDYRSAYTLFPIGERSARIWAAVYAFGGGTTSHLGVFVESNRRWRRTDGLHAPNRLYVYPVGGASIPTVVVIDHFFAADGWLGALQVWSVSEGKLTKRGERHEPLRFYEQARAGAGLRVAYREFARCLGVSVAGLSLSTFELSVQAIDGMPVVHKTTTAPWVVAVDEACEAVRAGRRPPIHESNALAASLRALRPDHVMLWDAKGDTTAGTGRVTVTSDTEKFFHFDVHQRSDGSWRIEKVTEGQPTRGQYDP